MQYFDTTEIVIKSSPGKVHDFRFTFTGEGELVSAGGTCGCTDVRARDGNFFQPSRVTGKLHIGETWKVGQSYTKVINAVVRPKGEKTHENIELTLIAQL